ncbi:LacI family DNA-binding transcriptional regulator [Martelella sp. AD-3]|uniref:LacI family DNA-binding transcriptional regulator n=1 Tax=Martelella sp. AD-3 TaxID=686597 RepID=UPI0018D43602|nr:LacI family DNA-binding transcriptional regulator [Martelella sp. AD-3]
MADIAKRAGVSTATVSRALTRPEQVNLETRLAIKKVAAELKFQPNLLGRQLRAGAAKSLLILVQDLSNSFFSELIKGAQTEALEHKYSIIVGDTDYYRDREKLFVDLFLGGRVDGLIMSTGHLPNGLNADLATLSPVVVISEKIPDINLPSVVVDNAYWSEAAVQYLIKHGHRRIAHIGGRSSYFTARERSRGYRNALSGANLPYDSQLEIETDFAFASGYAAAKQILSAQSPPTAIFCASDELALGAMRAVQDGELSVPNDVSIVGFDDNLLASVTSPTLTTIRQPRREIGAAAVRLALDMIEDRPIENRNVQLECHLIERGSVTWRNC